MTLSTTPAQGMGQNYHWLHGLSQINLLHCTEAEARLMAAAPELLEALKLIANAENSVLDLAYCKGIARAAIAKATGGQP